MTKEMNITPHRNLEDSILNWLRVRPGKSAACHYLAMQLDVPIASMRAKLVQLEQAGKLQSKNGHGRKVYCIPVEAEAVPDESQRYVAPFRPYRVPQEMRERMAEITAQREAHPSFYGSDNNPQP